MTMGFKCRKCGTVIQPGACYLVTEDSCPTCKGEDASEGYRSPTERQAAALELIEASIAEAHKTNEHLLRIGERIAAALENIAELKLRRGS